MASEADFLRWIASQTRASDFVRIGLGDDLAAIKWTEDSLLFGIDQVLDGIHFDSKVHPLRDIGRKAMNRNISDCAAMACLPTAAVVSVALARGSSMEFAKELYLGLRDAGDAFDCAIVGGDTSAWDGRLAISVAIIGRSAGIDPIIRGGAKVGDGIFVTGALGGSILGRHLTFTPRVHLARDLASTGKITAMLDISDGLSRDLRNLCDASNVGAIIQANQIPIHDDARLLAGKDGRSPLDHAVNDGEDHELLFTASPDLSHSHCIHVGMIVERTSGEANPILIEDAGKRQPLLTKGWQARW